MNSCEYCLNLESQLNYNKPLFQSDECNVNAGARIILNGKTLFMSDIFDGLTTIHHCEINFCPMCGRTL